MNKKIFLLSLVVVEILSIFFEIIFKINNIILIILNIFIGLYILGTLVEHKFVKEKRVNILEDKRNYDEMIICDEMYKKHIDKSPNIYVRTNFNSNFYTDFLILERYYSFVKEKGKIIFVFDGKNNKYFKSKKIDSLEYPFLHPVTLRENNIKLDSLKYKLIKHINPMKILLYKLKIHTIRSYKQCNQFLLEEKIEKLYTFTSERNMRLKIILKNLSNIDELKAKFKDIEFAQY